MKMILNTFCLVMILICSARALPVEAQEGAQIPMPRIRQDNVSITAHGDTRIDEYQWLREDAVMNDDKDPSDQLRPVVDEQNNYVNAVMQSQSVLKEQLKRELTARQETRNSMAPLPTVDRGYEYWETKKTKDIAPQFFRKKLGTTKEELLIDGPALAGTSKYIQVIKGKVSPDGKSLPYWVDLSGNRQGTLYVKDLATGTVRVVRENDVKVSKTYWQIAWSADSRFIFYSVPGSVGRDTQVNRANLSHDKIVETKVFDETDKDFYLFTSNSASGKYILLWSYNNDYSVVRAISAENPDAPMLTFSEKRKGHFYSVDHASDRFVIRSNRGGQFALWTTTSENAQENSWQMLPVKTALPEVHEVSVFNEYAFVIGHKNAEEHGYIVSLVDGAVKELKKTDLSASFEAFGIQDPSSSLLHVKTASMIQPPTYLEVDMKSGATKILAKTVLPDYDPQQFEVRRVNFDSTDSVKVPSFIAKKKTLRTSLTPAIVNVYGHYKSPYMTYWEYEPENGKEFISLLNRGVAVVYGIARGSGDMAPEWAEGGSLQNKRKTFEDTVAILRGLARAGLSDSSKLVLKGFSAGGLNAGYVANEAPDAVNGLVASEAFVDILNTMSDKTIPMTTQEFGVWGNPIESADDYRNIKSYAPYENIRTQKYPAIFASVSLHDSQVPYWEPMKWIARLQNHQSGEEPIMLRIYLQGSHSGNVGPLALEASAEEQAFILSRMGITK